MRSLGLFLIWSVLLISATQEVSGDCKYRRDEVEEGRTCKKKCKRNSDCEGKNKECRCDDLCGMSCFNPKSRCLPPKALPNGLADFSSSVYGSEILYSCKEGFQLKGDSERVCRSDGKWSGKAPKCVALEFPITCKMKDYEELKNEVRALRKDLRRAESRITELTTTVSELSKNRTTSDANACSTDSINSKNIKIYQGPTLIKKTIAIGKGKSLFISCVNRGESVIGSNKIRCTGGNNWSRSPEVLCEKRNKVCKLDFIDNTLEAFYENNDEITSLPANVQSGSYVKFLCKPPDQGETLVECENGEWQSPLPNRCVTGKTCPDVKPLTNGKMKVSPSDSTPPYDPGVIITFSCDQYFTLTSAPSMRCQDNGRWSEEPSRCKDVGCFLVTFNLKTGVYVDKHRDIFEDITVDAGERLVLKCKKSDKQLPIKCEGKLKWDKPYEEFTCD